MVAIFIDFENVKSEGLKGVEFLLDSDKLYLFYSNACPSLPIESYKLIMQSGCDYHAIKLKQSGTNFLDMYIASACGELIGNGYEGDIAIVSKDKGFQSVVDYWGNHEKNKRRIIRGSNVVEALITTQDKEGKLRRRILAENARKVDIEEEYIKYRAKKELDDKLDACFHNTEYEEFLPKIKLMLHEENDMTAGKLLYLNSLKTFGRKNGVQIYRKIKAM